MRCRSAMVQDQAAYTMENVVADVVGVMEALGHDRMTLVVHDWGGLIGWCAADSLHLHCTQLLSCSGCVLARQWSTTCNAWASWWHAVPLLLRAALRELTDGRARHTAELPGSPCIYRAVAATRPDLVDRLIIIGLPHPLCWEDNMSLSQACMLHLGGWRAEYRTAALHQSFEYD